MSKVLNANTDNTLGGSTPSDYVVPSQKAVKEYVDSKDLKVLSDTEGNITVGALGGVQVTIDAALSTTSTNPVQNKVITNAISDKLDTSLSNLSSAGHKVIDGQWVNSGYTLESSASALTSGTKDYSLSSYLPNDGYVYEVLVRAWANAGTANGNMHQISLRPDILSNHLYVLAAKTISGVRDTVINTVMMPVGTGRKITLISYSSNTGTYGLACIGYRRVGTNT